MEFEEFAAHRLPAVLRFAAVLTGDRAQAEDVVQEVLIRAYPRWRHIERMDRPEDYVRKMVLNEFLSWRRRSWRVSPAGRDLEVEPGPDHAVGYVEREAIMRELAKPPRRQRAVLVLRFYEGFSEPRSRACSAAGRPRPRLLSQGARHVACRAWRARVRSNAEGISNEHRRIRARRAAHA